MLCGLPKFFQLVVACQFHIPYQVLLFRIIPTSGFQGAWPGQVVLVSGSPNTMAVSEFWRDNCCFFICLQISQEEGKVVWYSHLFKNFPQFVVIHTEALVQSMKQKQIYFLEFCCFFYDPTDVSNMISGFSTFSKSSLYTWKVSIHVLLKPDLKDFEHEFTSMWNEHNCTVV